MFGIVIVAGYLLWAMQRTLFGAFEYSPPEKYEGHEIGRAPVQDIAPLIVLLLLVIALGVMPDLFYRMIQDAVAPMLQLGGGV